MQIPTLEEMLKAGVHIGHKKERSYPKSKKYTFCVREGVYVIDLEKTQEMLKAAAEFLTKSVKEGKNILFVGTKRQIKSIVENVAKEAGMPYISERWLGGTLTNFETVRRNIKHLEELENLKKSDEYKNYTKHEKLKIDEEIEKLNKIFAGILKMDKLPDILFVVDSVEEENAVKEAIKKEIPIVAVCDTNANPDIIDYPIPANDDALKSVELIVKFIGNVIKETKKMKKK